ncbi:hypothetical protein ABK040_013474 [Willaertia magna]
MTFPERAKPHFKPANLKNRAQVDSWRVNWQKAPVLSRPSINTVCSEKSQPIFTTTDHSVETKKDVAVDQTQNQYRLVSSAHSAILEMLLTCPHDEMIGEDQESKLIKQVYENIFAFMPKYTRFTILTDKLAVDTVKDLLTKYERNSPELTQIIVAEDNSANISIWAEDAYVCNFNPEKNVRYLTTPIIFPRYADSMIATTVSNDYNEKQFETTPLKVHPTSLIFQGGNTLIGDDFFMVGKDYLMNTIQFIKEHQSIAVPKGETEKDVAIKCYKTYLDTTRRLIFPGTADERPCPNQITVPFLDYDKDTLDGKQYRNEVLYFGNGRGAEKVWEPLFHIDMFITLLGRNKETNKYQVLVASPKLAIQTLGWDKEKARFAYAMQLSFDEIAKQLEDEGFEVDRMPLPMVYYDSEEDNTRYWYFTTYNNCLVQIPLEDNETVNGIKVEKKVWLPQYGYGDWKDLEKTDKQATEIFEKYGFTVQPMGDFHPFTYNLGALHCIKKYLWRSVPSN